MRKAKSLLGLHVISQQEGKNLGNIRDLIFDEGATKLLAVLLSDRELFGMIDAVVVPWPQVREIGPHAIMIPTEEALIKAHADPTIAASYDTKKRIDGKKITTQQGEDLGSVSDIYIENNGDVRGFEVSGGVFSDAFSGKRYLDLPSELTVGADRILVPQNVALELRHQKDREPRGLAGTFGEIADTIADKTGDLATKANTAYDAAKAKASATYENIANASVEKQREYVIGKVASRDVIIPPGQAFTATPQAVETLVVEDGGVTDIAPEVIPEIHTSTPAAATDVTSTGEVVNGEILVRSGQAITAAHADRAIATGVLAQLLASAASGSVKTALHGSPTAAGPTDTVKSKLETAVLGKPSAREIIAPDGSVLVAPGMIVTQEILNRADIYGKKHEVIAAAGMGAASEKAQDVYGTARETAGGIWNTLKEKTAELTGTAQEKKADYDAKAELTKIHNALGRPVTRVILASDDSIILNTGDLITNAAVSRAREAGVLNILLDSVFIAKPEITVDMLRAQGKGDAALDEQVVPVTPVVNSIVEPEQVEETEENEPQREPMPMQH